MINTAPANRVTAATPVAASISGAATPVPASATACMPASNIVVIANLFKGPPGLPKYQKSIGEDAETVNRFREHRFREPVFPRPVPSE
jgi:hypothetical protein